MTKYSKAVLDHELAVLETEGAYLKIEGVVKNIDTNLSRYSFFNELIEGLYAYATKLHQEAFHKTTRENLIAIIIRATALLYEGDKISPPPQN